MHNTVMQNTAMTVDRATIVETLFGGLTTDDSLTQLPPGALVFEQSTPPEGIFVLVSGRVALTIAARNGAAKTIRVAEPGEILGLSAVIAGKAYDSTAQVVETATVGFVGRETFLQYLRLNPRSCFQVLQSLSRDLAVSYDVIRTLGAARHDH